MKILWEILQCKNVVCFSLCALIRIRLRYFSIQYIEDIDSDIRDSKLRLESACVCTYAKSAGFT